MFYIIFDFSERIIVCLECNSQINQSRRNNHTKEMCKGLSRLNESYNICEHHNTQILRGGVCAKCIAAKRPRLIAYEMTEEERQYFENIEEEEYGVIVTNTNVNNV